MRVNSQIDSHPAWVNIKSQQTPWPPSTVPLATRRGQKAPFNPLKSNLQVSSTVILCKCVYEYICVFIHPSLTCQVFQNAPHPLSLYTRSSAVTGNVFLSRCHPLCHCASGLSWGGIQHFSMMLWLTRLSSACQWAAACCCLSLAETSFDSLGLHVPNP